MVSAVELCNNVWPWEALKQELIIIIIMKNMSRRERNRTQWPGFFFSATWRGLRKLDSMLRGELVESWANADVHFMSKLQVLMPPSLFFFVWPELLWLLRRAVWLPWDNVTGQRVFLFFPCYCTYFKFFVPVTFCFLLQAFLSIVLSCLSHQ